MLTLTALLLSFDITFSGKICSFVALEGIGYPIGTCMYASEKDPNDPTQDTTFAFEFICDSSQVSAKYWESTTTCLGRSDLEMDDYYCAEDSKLSGQECNCRGRGSACDTFTIEMNKKDSNCESEEDQSTSVVVNECIPTGFGGSQKFECDDTTLAMETWTNDKCDGPGTEGGRVEFDYGYLNDNHCLIIECTQGQRKIRKCKHRGDNAAGNINDKGIHIINAHINNHHLFVKDIINKHRLKMNAHINNNIFDMHNNMLLYTLVAIVTMIVFVGVIGVYRWCSDRIGYRKIKDMEIM
eukprot:157442_1